MLPNSSKTLLLFFGVKYTLLLSHAHWKKTASKNVFLNLLAPLPEEISGYASVWRQQKNFLDESVQWDQKFRIAVL